MRRDNNPLQLLKLLGSVKTTFPEVLKWHGNNNKYNNNKIIYSVLSIDGVSMEDFYNGMY